MSDDGRLVAGRYRLGKRLGKGGMGIVWLAYDERLRRSVAVKELLLPAHLTGEEAEQAKLRAMRESRIAARILHPNVIAIYDVVEADSHPCLVMEYLPSKSLSEVVAERGPLPPREVAHIGAQAARALRAAHVAGVVHRDVKPGNVLLGDGGIAKLADFGISRAAGDITVTATGLISGTPAYIAPEVAKGREATAASDVFSLGSTLYAAVEGTAPFGPADNAIALLHSVASGELNPPRRAGPLTEVLLELLQTDASRRPNMGVAAERLGAVAAGRAGTRGSLGHHGDAAAGAHHHVAGAGVPGVTTPGGQIRTCALTYSAGGHTAGGHTAGGHTAVRWPDAGRRRWPRCWARGRCGRRCGRCGDGCVRHHDQGAASGGRYSRRHSRTHRPGPGHDSGRESTVTARLASGRADADCGEPVRPAERALRGGEASARVGGHADAGSVERAWRPRRTERVGRVGRTERVGRAYYQAPAAVVAGRAARHPGRTRRGDPGRGRPRRPGPTRSGHSRGHAVDWPVQAARAGSGSRSRHDLRRRPSPPRRRHPARRSPNTTS